MAGSYVNVVCESDGFDQSCLAPNIPDFDLLCGNSGSVGTADSADTSWSDGFHGYDINRESNRGRPPAYRNTTSDDTDDQLSIRRERNKVAANKCRQKKKEHVDKIRKEFERLQGRHRSLQSLVQELSQERQSLFQMLEKHRPTCRRLTGGAATNRVTNMA